MTEDSLAEARRSMSSCAISSIIALPQKERKKVCESEDGEKLFYVAAG